MARTKVGWRDKHHSIVPCTIPGCKYPRGIDGHPIREQPKTGLGLPRLIHHDKDGHDIHASN